MIMAETPRMAPLNARNPKAEGGRNEKWGRLVINSMIDFTGINRSA